MAISSGALYTKRKAFKLRVEDPVIPLHGKIQWCCILILLASLPPNELHDPRIRTEASSVKKSWYGT
jgi:hypothetical protein